ncbi:hypothetical protein GCM10009547_18440 [Sporichthya brevicatena]|uniref:Uncharacterized protein n=1 Tax=Sporichthya brevicatena TaxID=171442 RepID=A0ABN1GQM8_9ACTN
MTVTTDRPVSPPRTPRTGRRRQDEPWTPAQLRIAVLGAVIGTVLLVVSWVAAGRTADVDNQLTWLSVAIVGFLIFASGGGALLLHGHRAVLHRWVVFLESEPAPVRVTERQADTGWVRVDGTRRAHRPDCQLVRGKRVAPTADAEIEERNLLRCEVCAG